jgi:hypothetical protein
MRCASCKDPASSSDGGVGPTEARVFPSILMLGALFGLMTSPCARAPLAGAFVIFGVPLLTFLVAAPGRLGQAAELRLFFRDVHAGMLAALFTVLGRRDAARIVVDTHRGDVERAYAANPRVQPLVAADPLRLHHARRLGLLGAALGVGAAVLLPLTQHQTYTWGEGAEAPFVFLFDLFVIGTAGRVVAERVAIRLFEASAALAGGGVWSSRLRTVPLVTMLGATLGAVGSLIVLFAASTASGIETMVVFDESFTPAALWFLRGTAPMALTLGIGIGAVMGAGCGFAQTDRR